MEGELQAVRIAAKASGEASEALVRATEKLLAAIKKNQANVAELDAKADRLAVVDRQLKETTEALTLKQQHFAEMSEKLAALKAAIPA